MTTASRACPLCGTILSSAKFAMVIRTHRGLERQLARLRAAEQRAKSQLQRAKEKASRAIEQERRRATDRLRRHQDQARKLRSHIDDLERRLKSGETAQSEGLLEERALLAFLKAHFDCDRFEHVGRGGDIIQHVCTERGAKAGTIVFEVKRVQQWASAHVAQCAEARLTRQADLAILVTNRFPANRPHYFVERDVLVISPSGLLPLVHTAREGLLNVHALRASGDEKRRAVQAVYDYLAGGHYMDHIRRVSQHFTDLEALFTKEVNTHKRVWNDRLGHYRGIVSGIADIHDQLRFLIGPAAEPGTVLPAEARRLLPQFRAK